MDSPSKTSEESRKITTDVTFPIIFTNDLQADLLSASRMTIEEQTMEGVQNVRTESESTLSPLIPEATTDEMYVPSPSYSVPTNIYDDLMACLCNDDDICQMRENTFEDLLQDEPIPLDDISLQVLKVVEELEQELVHSVTNNTTSTSPFTSNSSEEVNISIPSGVVICKASTCTGEGSSKGLVPELGGNIGVLNPILSPENCSNFTWPLPQSNTNLWLAGSNAWYPPQVRASSFENSMFPDTTGNSQTQFQSPSFPVHPYGCVSTSVGAGAIASASASVGASALDAVSAGANASVVAGANASVVAGANASASTTVRLNTIDAQDTTQVVASFSNFMFPNTTGNLLTEFQSCSSPSFSVLPYDSSSSSSHQQFPSYSQYQMTGIYPQGIPATMPQNNRRLFCLRPPPLNDFPNFVHAWEGSLIGKIHSYRISMNQARAVRKPSSPVTLTARWWSRLDIALFIPTTTVNYKMKIYGGPIDYVFFHIIQFNNLDLYDYLRSKNLCAKIDVPSQTIILFTTDSKYHFLGAVFQGIRYLLNLPNMYFGSRAKAAPGH